MVLVQDVEFIPISKTLLLTCLAVPVLFPEIVKPILKRLIHEYFFAEGCDDACRKDRIEKLVAPPPTLDVWNEPGKTAKVAVLGVLYFCIRHPDVRSEIWKLMKSRWNKYKEPNVDKTELPPQDLQDQQRLSNEQKDTFKVEHQSVPKLPTLVRQRSKK